MQNLGDRCENAERKETGGVIHPSQQVNPDPNGCLGLRERETTRLRSLHCVGLAAC